MNAMLSRLVWKDALLVKNLVLIAAVAVVAVNLVIVFVTFSDPLQIRDTYSFAIGMRHVFPFLVAFGIPALLIGTEEESGTLAWLRTLPVPRYQVIYAKLLVALAAVAVIWALSSTMLLIVSGLVFHSQESVITKEGLFFNCDVLLLLLLIGFVTSYAFRSPISALLSALPIIAACFASITAIEVALQENGLRDFYPTVSLVVGTGFMLLLLTIQHQLALRRLQPARWSMERPRSGLSLVDKVHFDATQTETAYWFDFQLRLRIPRIVRALGKQAPVSRPTPTRAMLWQAMSQQAIPAIVLTLMALAGSYYLSPRQGYPIINICVMVVVLSMCWLGTLTFYGDTIQRRHLFFADRGVSATRVWVTRMLLPSCAIALIVLMTVEFGLYNRGFVEKAFVSIVIGIVAFAIGSLSSQWATRPVLGLIISPVLLAIVLSLLAGRLYNYQSYWSAVLLSVIPLLIATWRLIPRWLKAQRGIGFDARALGSLVLGMALVYVYVHAHRFATIPAAEVEWRENQIANSIKFSSSEIWTADSLSLVERRLNNSRETTDLDTLTRIYAETLAQVAQARGAIVRGEANSSLLPRIEFLEQKVLEWCRPWILKENEDLDQVMAALAPDSLRRESRRIAIAREWEMYQSQEWQVNLGAETAYQPKTLFGKPVAKRHVSSWTERLRADRFVDAATKATLEYVEARQVNPKDLRSLWGNVYYGQNYQDELYLPISLIADELIVELSKISDNK